MGAYQGVSALEAGAVAPDRAASGTTVKVVREERSREDVRSGGYGTNDPSGGDQCERCFDLKEAQNGNYVAVGYTESYGEGNEDIYFLKFNSAFTEDWHQTYGGSGTDIGRGLALTTDGGYIITGFTNSFGSGDHDIYLVKTDVSGNEIWSRTFGGSNDDYGYSVVQTSDGGYVIAGYTESYGAGEADVYLIKVRENP